MKTLEQRIQRLEQARQTLKTNFVIRYTPGEPDAEIERRVEAAGRPVVLAPMPCETIEEWVELARAWRG